MLGIKGFKPDFCIVALNTKVFNLQYEVFFMEDKRETKTTRYPNGNIKSEITYKSEYSNVKNGKALYYHENGKIERKENYKDDERNGEWIWYYEDGNIEAKGTYNKYGKPYNGTFISYNLFGKKYKGTYKNGKLDGEWIYYDENDNIEVKETYKNGNRDGETRFSYYENGNIKLKETYNKDYKKDGEWIWYYEYEDGNIEAKGIFKDGEPYNGTFIEYDHFDRYEITYKDGKLIKQKIY